ncbi:MAG TPA: sulfatase-like hydrolase/transferase [Nocardioidaceae bacterium]
MSLVVAAGALVPGTGVAAPEEDRPPNILLITTDDQHAADLEHMPITRRLIGDAGVTFTDAVSTYPWCCPARAVLATGLLNHNNGVLGNKPPFGGYAALKDGAFADETVPTWLNGTDHGYDYESAFIGKFLNGYAAGWQPGTPHPVPVGWDYFAAGMEGTGLYNFHAGEVNVLDRTAGTQTPTVEPTGKYRTYYNTEQVHARIEHAVGDPAEPGDDKPFFIWQSELAPHGACWPRKDRKGCDFGKPMWAAEDDGKFTDLPLRAKDDPSFDERVVADKPDYVRKSRRWGDERVAQATEFHRARIRSLQSVDRSVGETVRRLDELGQLDNTLIIFTSDNGFLLGEHRRWGKIVPYEPSVRVPLLMRGPGVPAGKVVDAPVSLVDIPATIADVARATPTLEQDGQPVALDGMSLLPVAAGGPGWGAMPIEAGDTTATEPDQWWYRGVRTRRYTYVEYERTGEAELYDRRRDPHQLVNVAYRPTHRATRRALAEKLDRLRDCSGRACRVVGGGDVPTPERDGTPIHPDELGSIGSATQVVTVTAPSWSSARGRLVAWRKVGRSWRVAGEPFPVRLGSNGLVRPRVVRHLRDTTPAGRYQPAAAMGLAPDPGTALPYRRLGRNGVWPFDPLHPTSYNVRQPYRPEKAWWRERLSIRWGATPRRYARVLVLDHNLPGLIYRSAYDERLAGIPADPRRGSLLLHTGSRAPRQGWVAMHPARMRWLQRWIDPAQRTTFVVGTPGYLRNRL